MDILYIIMGIGLLYFGGEWLLSGTLSASVRLGIPRVLASVLLIGFGTSAPELFVSFKAVLAGNTDIAVGNVMGSNMANILLIGGAGMVLAPIAHRMQSIGYEATFFGISSVIPLIAVCVFSGMTLGLGGVSLAILCVYFTLAITHPHHTHYGDDDFTHMPLWKIVVYVGVGIATLVIGADILIMGAVNLATTWGVSQAIIGVSMVAVGTSLPEIATTLSAARKGHGDMIIGNIVGSNMFNTLLVLGGVGAYTAFPIAYADFSVEIFAVPILSVILILAIYTNRLNRVFGGLLLGGYTAYIVSWIL